MKRSALAVLTIVTTALAAFALFILPYEAGVFPGGVFEDSNVGPLPLWTICAGLIALLTIVCLGTLARMRGDKNPE